MNPALVDDQAPVSAELTGFGGDAVMRPGRDRAERINESAFIRDVWYVLARASTDNAPRTLAAARDRNSRRAKMSPHRSSSTFR
jgi:hypothetical protein